MKRFKKSIRREKDPAVHPARRQMDLKAMLRPSVLGKRALAEAEVTAAAVAVAEAGLTARRTRVDWRRSTVTAATGQTRMTLAGQ